MGTSSATVDISDLPPPTMAAADISDLPAPAGYGKHIAGSYEGTEADTYAGVGEAALHYGTAAAASALAGVNAGAGRLMGWAGVPASLGGMNDEQAARNVADIQKRFTYQPRTEAGKAAVGAVDTAGRYLVGVPSQAVGDSAAWVAKELGLSPEAQAYAGAMGVTGAQAAIPAAEAKIVTSLPQIASGVGNAGRALANQTINYGGEAPAVAADTSQFAPGGSSSATLTGRLATASPELADGIKESIQDAQTKYGADWQSHVDFKALDAQLEADSLPIPGRHTPGQASGDPTQISLELNNRSRVPGAADFYDWQNKNQAANLEAIREQVGPDVSTTTPTEHGQALIDAYKAADAPRKQAIDDAWGQIRSQTGDAPIFDAGRMLQDAQAALQKSRLTAYDPAGQLAQLTSDAQRGGLTADGYNAFRQVLGREAMKGGNEGAAASAIIEGTNATQLLPQAAQFRSSVNEALAMGRARWAQMEADPAYEAAVNGTVSSKDFVNKVLANGKPENVSQMLQSIGNNDVARQTMGVAVLDHLRDAARLNDRYEGNFAAPGFNNQLRRVTQSAGDVFQNGEVQTLQALGNYASRNTFQPRGSWANNSGTTLAQREPGIVAKTGDVAASAAEAVGNKIVPYAHLGTIVRSGIQGIKARNAAAAQQAQQAQFLYDMTKPGAGVVK